MSNVVDYSRTPETALFGKLTVPLTVNVSEATHEQIVAQAAIAGVPVSELIRAIIEEKFWGIAEITARLHQRRVPMGIRRITGEPQ